MQRKKLKLNCRFIYQPEPGKNTEAFILSVIIDHIQHRKHTQKEVGEILAIHQSDVSRLLGGRERGCSLLREPRTKASRFRGWKPGELSTSLNASD